MIRYETDRAWSDRFIPTIREIIGPLLLQTAPLMLDRNEATDLMLLIARDMRIACRIRRPGFVEQFGDQFTMRSQLHRSGRKTEIHKIADGYGDLMFYGHALTPNGPKLKKWMLIDLNAWRYHIKNHLERIDWGERSNKDQETSFVWFDVRTFPSNPYILVAEGGHA